MRFESLTSQLRNEFDESKLPSLQYSSLLGSRNAANIDFKAIADALDCHRDFYGAGIIYSDGLSKRYLVRPSKRRGSPVSSELTHIIIFNLEAGASPEVELKKTVSEPSLMLEIGSTAISCGGAVATVLGGVASGMAVPFTGGGSTAGVILAYSGFAATAAQCINGGYRVYQLTANGDEGAEHIAWLDSQDWYVTTTTILDITSLASGSAALKEAYQTYKIMKATSPRKASEWLKNMPRHERKRLTEEIMRHNNPGISNQAIKRAIGQGKYIKRYPTEEIQNTLRKHLKDSLIAGSGFVGSGMSGSIRNPENIFKTGDYIIGTIYSVAYENQ
ncbi:hypothetical protein FE394_05690 [Xenorhabdus sp. Reich]|uniref:Uncharacterized protein n=1 Tax=Xenorhabdus littoralis TaxID=2582835 RepID=A0ABU4SJ59_9GAMM|nr:MULTISPECIES: hypothetical protein [unclassified Xenorhabdus]MDX7993179.1 hypothetical protein [Xenorhabdus sp. psl]MDX7998695.1 hypothetical protein [Xenorhabdus sp. Reich]